MSLVTLLNQKESTLISSIISYRIVKLSHQETEKYTTSTTTLAVTSFQFNMVSTMKETDKKRFQKKVFLQSLLMNVFHPLTQAVTLY